MHKSYRATHLSSSTLIKQFLVFKKRIKNLLSRNNLPIEFGLSDAICNVKHLTLFDFDEALTREMRFLATVAFIALMVSSVKASGGPIEEEAALTPQQLHDIKEFYKQLGSAILDDDQVKIKTSIRDIVKTVANDEMFFIGYTPDDNALAAGTLSYWDGHVTTLQLNPLYAVVTRSDHIMHRPEDKFGGVAYVKTDSYISHDKSKFTHWRSYQKSPAGAVKVVTLNDDSLKTDGVATLAKCANLKAQVKDIANTLEGMENGIIVLPDSMYCPETLLTIVTKYHELTLGKFHTRHGDPINYVEKMETFRDIADFY